MGTSEKEGNESCDWESSWSVESNSHELMHILMKLKQVTSKKIRKRFSKTSRFKSMLVWGGKSGKYVKTNQGS